MSEKVEIIRPSQLEPCCLRIHLFDRVIVVRESTIFGIQSKGVYRFFSSGETPNTIPGALSYIEIE
jgi:hypothetical protein